MSGSFDDTSKQGGKNPGYTGTRVEAIERGDIVDVTAVALEVGFLWHVSMTTAVWNDCVAWSEQDSDTQLFQTERMRLVEVLRMAAFCIRISNPKAARLGFTVSRVPRNGRSKRASEVKLDILAHVEEDGERVLTILQPAGEANG